MEDNRFLRTYQEHKREKEQNKLPVRDIDNRFECLRDKPIQRSTDNRFECLRGNVNINPNESQDERINQDTNNRFSCLADDTYRNQPVKSAPSNITYLPRPEPRESVNSQMRRLREEKKVQQPKRPVFSYESEFHFPELGKSADTPVKTEIKLPEPKAMIVNTVVVPINKPTMTVFSFINGKMVTKEIYEDGSDAVESGVVMVKKPNYSSWASVLKKEKNETIYYDKEEYVLPELNDSSKKN
jgi:hypothetical protein